MKNFSAIIASGILLIILTLSTGAQAQIKGWGLNSSGQLGIGSFNDPIPTPATITAVPDATGIKGFQSHTLFLKADGTVVGAGLNGSGQLGNGTFDSPTFETSPVAVLNLTNVTQVSGGWVHSVALRSDGTVWGWGHNNVGQLGTGANSTNSCQCSAVPVQTLISNVVQIDSGTDFVLALKADGTVWAWGLNRDGQIGDGAIGNPNYRTTPVQVGVGVAGFNNIIAVSAGNFHSMALKADGTVWVWGTNDSGMVGNGTSVGTQLSPVKNTTLSNVVQIDGADYNVALKADGTIWMWGSNSSGQAGNGTTSGPLLVPTQNTTMTNVVSIKAGNGTTMAKTRDGSIWMWGNNNNGQIGNGTVSPQNTGCHCITSPVQSSVGSGNAVINANGYNNFAGIPSFTTPAGANVRQFGENVSFTFPNVTAPGTTGYTAIDPTTTGLNVPKNYTIQGNAPAYNITSTATSSGKNNICMSVQTEYNPTQFALLKILHEEGSNLVDRTVSSTFIKRQICAGADSLGRFVVAKERVPVSFTVSGRVLDGGGRAVSRATVLLTDAQGNNRLSKTNGFGYFMFEAVTTGETYTFTISGKGYVFSPQTITLHDTTEVLLFTAQ